MSGLLARKSTLLDDDLVLDELVNSVDIKSAFPLLLS